VVVLQAGDVGFRSAHVRAQRTASSTGPMSRSIGAVSSRQVGVPLLAVSAVLILGG
jgi:hypothetical protein